MDKEKFLTSGILEKYVLGLTSEEENQEVMRYFDAFPELKAEADELGAALEEYARQYAIDPPEDLKSKVLEEIDNANQVGGTPVSDTTAQPRGIARRGFPTWAVLATSLTTLVLAIFALNLTSTNSRLEKDLNELQASFDNVQTQCAEERTKLQNAEQVLAFIKNEHTRAIYLKGSGLAPEAEAVVFWNGTSKNAFLNPVNLPAPPEGKQYQIWADVEGEMINMGIFEAGTNDLQTVKYIANAESLNITLEPTGGSEHPTVELLYANGRI